MQAKRKFLSILLTLCMVLMSVPTVVFAVEADADWGSDYETAKEFTISTEAELRAFAKMVNEGKDFAGKTVKLADNITMSDAPWVPIGSVDYMVGNPTPASVIFAGNFDGQGNTISNLVIDCGKGENDPAYDAVGLFGCVSGTIKNVALTDLSISAACDYVGGIAGRLMDNAVISCCTVQGSISGAVYEGDGDAYGSQMGGIAGATENACENVRIENCVNEATLNGRIEVGGIIGSADGRFEQSVTLLNCTNKGKVNGGSYHVGGIVGSADGTVISSGINEGAVTGTYDDNIQLGNRGVGGIVGNAVDEVELTDCRNSGDIVAPQQEWVGGIAGRLHQGSSVNGCTNSGAIQGGDKTGGVVGYADAYVDGYQVADCANTGKVSGANAVGGIVGHTSASNRENANISVTDCTNSGAVSGDSAVGGIVGDHSSSFAIGANNVQTSATVSNCINTGSVPAGAGAIVGNNNTNNNQVGKVESNFWPESVGQNAVGSGAGSAGDTSGSEAVKNNSAWGADGSLLNPNVEGTDGEQIKSICEVVGHSYGADWKYDNVKHWHECTVCGEKTEENAHAFGDWTQTKAPSCTETGLEERVCTDCGHKETREIPTTDHTAGPEWKFDETGHWKECTDCGAKLDEAEHTFKWVTDKDATATEAGSKHEECEVCGYKKAAVEIPATGTTEDPSEPSEPSNPGETPEEPSQDNPDAGETDSPQTGDNSNIALLVVLMGVGAAGIVATVLLQKRRKIKE